MTALYKWHILEFMYEVAIKGNKSSPCDYVIPLKYVFIGVCIVNSIINKLLANTHFGRSSRDRVALLNIHI